MAVGFLALVLHHASVRVVLGAWTNLSRLIVSVTGHSSMKMRQEYIPITGSKRLISEAARFPDGETVWISTEVGYPYRQ